MSVPVLPASLPQKVLRDAWSLVPVSPHRRTEMDSGETAVTRRVSRTVTVLTVAWELDGIQLEIAHDFWERDLDAGRMWFRAPVFVGFRDQVLDCRFRGDPPFTTTSPQNGVFNVSFELELRQMPTLTPSERLTYDAFALSGGDVDALAAQLIQINAALEGLATWR